MPQIKRKDNQTMANDPYKHIRNNRQAHIKAAEDITTTSDAEIEKHIKAAELSKTIEKGARGILPLLSGKKTR